MIEARRYEVRGVVQGVGFRPFVWRLAARHALAGSVRNASGVVEIQRRARRRPSTRSRWRSPSRRRPSRAWTTCLRARRDGRVRAGSWWRRPPTARRGAAGLAGRGHLRGVPRGAPRPRRPALPLPVHQLHRLRPAVHDHRGVALRPRAHVDAGVPHVRRTAAASTRTRRIGASTPSRSRAPRAARARVPRSRRPARRRRPTSSRRRGPDRARGGRRHQGPRRVPPGVRRDRRGRGRPAARPQAPPRQALRGDGARRGRPRGLVRARPRTSSRRSRPGGLRSCSSPTAGRSRASVAPGFTAGRARCSPPRRSTTC